MRILVDVEKVDWDKVSGKGKTVPFWDQGRVMASSLDFKLCHM